MLVLTGGIATVAGAANPLAVLGAAIVAASAVMPRIAVVVAVPVTVFVSLLPGLGTAALVVTAAIQVGVLARCWRNLQRGPTLTVLIFAALLTLSHLRDQGGFGVAVGADAARNTLLSTLIGVALVLSAMAAAVGRLAMLKALAATGAASSLYLLNIGSVVGGRLATENFNANATGHIAALAVLSAWGVFVTTRRPEWLVSAAPAVLLLVLSQSRGALVIAAVGFAIPWIFIRVSVGRVVLATSISGVLYMAWPVVSAGLAKLLWSRAFTESETRVNILEVALRAVAEHPLTGLGWRRFPDYSYHHLGVVLNTHNEYARMAAEAGLPALAALVVLAGMGLRRAMSDRSDRALKGVLLGGLTALAFANSLSLLAICAPLWLVLGNVLAAGRERAVRRATNTDPTQPVAAARLRDRWAA